MSIFSDWDLAYCLTFEALNRKLARIHYKQRGDKHLVKRVVARAIDPQGLTGRFQVYVPAGGGGQYNRNAPPTIEIWYAEDKQQQQAAQFTPDLNSAGVLTGLNEPTLLPLLFYPPSISIKRQTNDNNTVPGAIFTGLGVGKAPLTTTKSLLNTLIDWLAGNTRQPGIVTALGSYFGRTLDSKSKQALLDNTTQKLSLVLTALQNLPTTTTAPEVCASLLEVLLKQVWNKAGFWQSNYLQTLGKYEDLTDLAELQQLYAYAMKLRDKPTDAALKGSTDATVLQQNIKTVYEYYHASEVANLRNEVSYRVKEVFFKVSFQFSTYAISEATLATTLTSDLLQCWAEALLETFACLVPTVVPDLLFGVADRSSTPPQVFAMRLGPCSFECDPALGGDFFRVAFPVTGGYYLTSTGELQALSDPQQLTYRMEYSMEMLRYAHKDPKYRLDPSNFADVTLRRFSTFTEGSNPTPAPGFLPYSFGGRVANTDVLLALDNHPPAAPDSNRYAHEFAYSLLPLFASFNILDDLPLGRVTDKYTALSWTAVTAYRFVLLQLTNDAQETSGQLYILGSVHPDGAATRTPNITGGELMQKRKTGDAIFYLSNYLLIHNLFLKNVAQTFTQRLADGSYGQATVADFIVTNSGSITNVNKVYVPYSQIKQIISAPDQATIEEAFSSDLVDKVRPFVSNLEFGTTFRYPNLPERSKPTMADVVFEVEAKAFSFKISDGILVMTFRQLASGTKVVLNDVSVSLEYQFSRRNGIERYTATGEQTIGSISLNLGSTWYYALRVGTIGLAGIIALGAGYSAVKTVRQSCLDLRRLVPPDAQDVRHKDAVIQQMFDYLRDQGGAVGRQPEVAINPPGVDDTQVGILDPRAIRQVPVRRAGGLSRLRQLFGWRNNQVQPAQRRGGAGLAANSAEALVRKYSAKIIKRLGGETSKKYGIILHKGEFKPDLGGLFYSHQYSFGLESITKHEDKLRIILRLDDARALGADEEIRHVLVEYSCSTNDIRDLAFEKVIKEGSNKYMFNSLAMGENLARSRKRYGQLMNDVMKKTLILPTQEILLETAYIRDEAYKLMEWTWTAVCTVLSALSPLAAIMITNWLEGKQAASEDAFRQVLGNRFINSYLFSQFNQLKYPYEEHFSVNEISINQEGLQVVMGALTSQALTFAPGLLLQQTVGTYVNVRMLTSIELSVADLQTYNQPASGQEAAAVPFTVSFGYLDVSESDSNKQLKLVGNQVPFRLTSTSEAGKISWALSSTVLPLAAFGAIGQANLLVVERKQALAEGEVNLFTVTLN